MKKRMIMVLVCALLLGTAAGCAAKEKENAADIDAGSEEGIELKIAFWGASGEEEALKEAAKGMEDTVDGIASIVWEQFPSVEEFYDTLPTESAIGRVPDIVMLNNEEQKSLIAAGFLEPLEETPNAQDYIGNVLDEWQYEGQLYGLPGTAAPALFIVNEDMWKEAGLTDYPASFEQVYEDAKVLKTHGFTPICIDISNLYHVTQHLQAFGGGWNGGTDIDTAENKAAVAYILKMFDEGLAVTAKDMGKSWDGEVFAAGECAMSTGGTWYMGAMKDSPTINYTMLPIPRTDEGNGKTLHSYGYAVMSGSQNKKTAQQAVKYLVREEAQKIRMEVTGDCPALVSLQDAYYELYPQLDFMKEELNSTQSFDYPVDSTLMDKVREKLEQRIYGQNKELTPEAILGN